MRETQVETYLREQVETRGGLCEKHVSPGLVGVPDRLITWNYAQMDLAETKAPGKKVRKKSPQDRDHKRRAVLGVEVHVLDTIEKVDDYIQFRRPFWRF